MPYSKAHFFVLGILFITVLAFWPSYFGKLSEASLAHHLHGITSTFWLLLIALQNYLAHSKNMALHRKVGKVLFILVPMMVGSFALVTLSGAEKSVAGHPFYTMFGQALLTVDSILIFAVPLSIYLGLKHRKTPQIHSALMIGSIAGLLPPILSRLFVNYIPSWQITGLDTMQNFSPSLHLSFSLTIVVCVALFILYRPHNWPWTFAGIVSLLVYVAYLTLGQTEIWQKFVFWLAEVPAIAIFSFGFVLGLLACILGWRDGKPKNSTS